VRRCYANDARLAWNAIDDQAFGVDGHCGNPRAGRAECRPQRRVARVLEGDHCAARRDEDARQQIEGLLRTGRD